MADLITYVADRQAMRDEGVALATASEVEVTEDGLTVINPLTALFSIDEDGGLTFNVTKVPVVYTKDGTKSVCLVRNVNRNLFDGITSIEILGEVQGREYVFDSDEARAKYESVYDTTERTFTDEDGTKHTYTPPYKIGVFL